jgi:hypothetical protein
MSFEGMTILHALNIMASFISFARHHSAQADGVVEFATYKGRVSSLIGQLMGRKSKLHLVDVNDYLDNSRMSSLGISYEFHKLKS